MYKQGRRLKVTRKIQSKVQVCKCSPIIVLQLLINFKSHSVITVQAVNNEKFYDWELVQNY